MMTVFGSKEVALPSRVQGNGQDKNKQTLIISSKARIYIQ